MKNKMFIVSWLIIFMFFTSLAYGQEDYNNNRQITDRLKKLATNYPNIASFSSITKTLGGQDICVLTIGSDDINNHPGIVIIGGVEGNHLLGTEMAVRFAEKLLANSDNDSIKLLLSTTTFYIFPNMSPDATEQYFANLKYERLGNDNNTDDDRDWKVNEDPFEDLNNDGMITLVRVRDPAGEWKTHTTDNRVMVKAGIEKGEFGSYRIFSEGIDNDKDGNFNEDGEGGVVFNKNFTFDYPYFTSDAGIHQVSEPETRALLDFLYDAWNVFAVVSFGEANNLSDPLKSSQRPSTSSSTDMGRRRFSRVIKSILPEDAKMNQIVSEKYNNIIGEKGAPKAPGTQGDFFQWAYFHYGRYSYSTPGWWVPKVEEKKERPTGMNAKTETVPIVEFLRWAEKNNIENVFVPWQKIQHPDFPEKEVEIGGIVPFVMKNPPYNMVKEIGEKHYRFLLELAEMKPQIDIINVKNISVSKNITRITADIYNKGLLSTTSEIGERNRWVRKVKVELTPIDGQTLIAGQKVQLLGNIQGDSSKQISWLIKGKGKIKLKAGSPNTGIKEIEITLK